jgi:hypothetical protein
MIKTETTEVAGNFNTLHEAQDWLASKGWAMNGLGEFRNPGFAGWVRSLRDKGLSGFSVVQEVSIDVMAELNADQQLDDLKVLWTGQTVSLMLDGKILTSLQATANIQDKIAQWCLKNSYRCTQIHDGKIWL